MTEKHTEWYFMVNYGRGASLDRGPFTTTQMKTFLKTGEITENTRIRYGIDSQWLPLGNVWTFAAEIRESKVKRTESGSWKKYGAALLVGALLTFAVQIYTREQAPSHLNGEQSPNYSVKTDNIVVNTLSREILSREAIIALTNNARALSGLQSLRANQQLNIIAESRAKDMLEKQYFAHVSPTGIQASDIAQSIGYHYKIIAENIASGNFYTNQKIVDGWMQSPGHRINILNREVEEMGAAVLRGQMKGEETYVAVQIFGLQSPPVSEHTCVAPPKNLLDDIELRKAEIASLIDQARRVKQELDMEKQIIETDRKYTYGDPQKIHDLNAKVNAYNEKIKWHSRIAMDATAKSAVLESMANEYNRLLEAYNNCLTSK